MIAMVERPLSAALGRMRANDDLTLAARSSLGYYS
jgi:hypothetical protein